MEVMLDGLVKDHMLAMQHINGSWNPLFFLFFSFSNACNAA
jgi:hypothetical protein